MYWNLLSHQSRIFGICFYRSVLILIVLEFALALTNPDYLGSYDFVLILIVLEFALAHPERVLLKCSEGVLILIVLEFALAQMYLYLPMYSQRVLILIVLEFALAHKLTSAENALVSCLNPYCTGICSRTKRMGVRTVKKVGVLILIVLEFALAQT